MKTLFSQIFVVFLASMCILLLIVGGLFLFGMRRSIQDWNIYRRHALQNLIVPHLQQVYRRDGMLTRESVGQALSTILTSSQYAYILDADHRPVYLFHRGDDLLLQGGEPVENVLRGLQDSREMLRAVFDGEQPIAFLRANTLGFLSDVANRRFIRSIGVSIVLGLLFSFLLALVVAYVFSRHVSRQTRAVASGLQRLSNGARDVRFRQQSALELHAIATSAEMLQDQLLQEEKLRRQWAEDIAHDLRTPIAALKTQFEGFKDGYLHYTPQRLDALFSELLLLEGLVNDLRELNRMESPEMKLDVHPVDAARFVDGIQRTFDILSARYRATLRTSCGIGEFDGDERLLTRGVGNVVQNAFQHVRTGGMVDFELHRSNDETVFEVSNSGEVDENEIPKLFNRLYRGRRDRCRAGSGLGLSITRAIVDLHQGRIEMFQNGDRTHVQLRIPVSIAAAGESVTPGHKSAKGWRTKRV